MPCPFHLLNMSCTSSSITLGSKLYFFQGVCPRMLSGACSTLHQKQMVPVHPVAYTTFCYLWRTVVPSVVVMKPRSNLHWQFQQNSAAIICTTNFSEAEEDRCNFSGTGISSCGEDGEIALHCKKGVPTHPRCGVTKHPSIKGCLTNTRGCYTDTPPSISIASNTHGVLQYTLGML